MMRFIHTLNKIKVAVFVIVAFLCASSAYAATKDEAVILAQEIMQVSLNTKSSQSLSLGNNNNKVMDIISKGQADSLEDFLNNLDNQASLVNFDLYENYAKLTEHSLDGLTEEGGYQLILGATRSKEWRTAYLANFLLADIHLGKNDLLKVFEFTGQSLEIINQQTVTAEIASMLYDVYDILYTAYIYDRSADQTIEAVRTLKDLSIKSGRPLDGVGIVNNMAALFSSDNRHLEAIEIMRVMEPYLEGQTADKTIIYNFSIAKFKNRAKLYNEALPHLELIESMANDTRFAPYIYNQMAISYAYSGAFDKAVNAIEKLNALPSEELPKGDLFQLSTINVKSQIAEMRGDHKTALRLKKQYSESYIDKINAAQFQDRKKAADRIAVSQRVATQKLENAARESALKDTIIDREKNINRISMGLLGLATIMVCLLVYGVRREKAMNKRLAAMNAELEVSRDKALASEKAKSDFLSMMSHEIRTPLNSIIPVAELLQAKSIYKDDRSLLSLIVTGGNTLLQMLDNVLVLSKADDAAPEYTEDLSPVKIAKPILKDYGDQAHKKGLSFAAKAEKGFPLTVNTDKKALEKILINLLSNAVKFTSEGDISIIFSRAENADYFSMKIKDTGIGMDSENLDILLEPFTQKDTGITRSFDGLGIGLSVTNIEVTRLGGELIINTDLDVGTEIEVILPIASQLDQNAPLELAA